MKLTSRLLFPSLSLFIFFSCIKEVDKTPVIGVWELVGWTVNIPLGKEGALAPSSNFLDLTTCDIKETLTFDTADNVVSNHTFSPKITIRLKDGTTDNYSVEEVCAEGQIGFSTSYDYGGPRQIEFNGAHGTIVDGYLTIVYKDAIKIYNASGTEVLESKDLSLTYLKR